MYKDRLARGSDALAAFERLLAARGGGFAAGPEYTVADVALYAYVHCAGDAGAGLSAHPGIGAWIERVEATPRFENDLEPLPAHAFERPA